MKPVVLFDGVCNLCNSSVQFILKRDANHTFLFAALQSERGKELMRKFDLPADTLDTIIVVDGDRYYQRSAAALRIARDLNALWPLFYAFMIVPRPIRDFFYKIVARNRYKWFGKRDACMIPTPEIRSRFLSDSEATGDPSQTTSAA